MTIEEQIHSFLLNVCDNFDCDEDGHKYETYCRACEANAILRKMGVNTQHQKLIDKGLIDDLCDD